jgi:hypothetical protein
LSATPPRATNHVIIVIIILIFNKYFGFKIFFRYFCKVFGIRGNRGSDGNCVYNKIKKYGMSWPRGVIYYKNMDWEEGCWYVTI